nr:MAG TPA: hypothetical protein [Crassvirales sp.]
MHISWSIHAHQVLDKCTTGDMQAHNSCCAVLEAVIFENLSYLFQQLLLSSRVTHQ